MFYEQTLYSLRPPSDTGVLLLLLMTRNIIVSVVLHKLFQALEDIISTKKDHSFCTGLVYFWWATPMCFVTKPHGWIHTLSILCLSKQWSKLPQLFIPLCLSFSNNLWSANNPRTNFLMKVEGAKQVGLVFRRRWVLGLRVLSAS